MSKIINGKEIAQDTLARVFTGNFFEVVSFAGIERRAGQMESVGAQMESTAQNKPKAADAPIW